MTAEDYRILHLTPGEREWMKYQLLKMWGCYELSSPEAAQCEKFIALLTMNWLWSLSEALNNMNHLEEQDVLEIRAVFFPIDE